MADTDRERVPAALVALTVVAVVAGVAGRFVADTPLWLDEALSVNIASLPLGDIAAALERDGHPPLYYALLHGWLNVFGDGDVAARAFSGVWSVALLPLAWVAGRRFAGRQGAAVAVIVAAVSPYAVRYGTETRMYAMVSVLVLAGWLLVDDALDRPTWPRLAAITAITGALLWTHYWAIWFLMVVGSALLVHRWRASRGNHAAARRATDKLIGAIVVGGLTFVPWLPTLLYQGEHTGTPWARPVRPTEMVIFTITDFGGGPWPETALLGVVLAVIALIGAFGVAVGPDRISLDLKADNEARPLLVLIVGTMAVACLAGYLTGATYATRYAAVFFPFFVLLVARGVLQFDRAVIRHGVLGVLVVLGGIGIVRNATVVRSDSARNAEAITARAEPGDVVVYCPDQLGPGGSRLLGVDLDQVTYPDMAPPERVDWVDYGERLEAADPDEFANDLVARAGSRRIFLVYSTNYDTHREICPALRDAVSGHRSPEELTRPTDAWEQSSVVVWEPPAP